MPERPDGHELTLLRAADPVDPASLPAPGEPAGRALLHRITTGPHAPGTSHGGNRARRPLVLVTAGVVVLAALGAGAATLLGRTGDQPDDEIVQTQPTPSETAGAISPGGPSMGSCVEVYDLQTLAKRELAFDGTLRRLDGDTATFTVNRWYRGGDSAETTVAGAALLTGITSAGPAATLEPGTRLLVAGDGGFAWACGFTQPYDARVARQWEASFGR